MPRSLIQLLLTGTNSTLVFVMLCLPIALLAQSYQFSQYNFTSQRVNPGMLGTTSYAQLDLDSRSQKTGGDFNIFSNYFAATYPLLNQSTALPWGGIGVSAMDDRSGGYFNTQEIALSYAHNVRLSRYQLLSFGLRGLYQTSRLTMDGFYTGSQYIPGRGFSDAISGGENFYQSQASVITVSAGAYWQQTDRKGITTGYWGLSLFDFNKPTYTFTGSPSEYPATLTFNGGFQALRKQDLIIFPELLYTRSSANNTFNAGVRFQRLLKAAPKKTPDHVDLLLKAVVGRSGIVGLQLHREKFSVGMSYDFPLFARNPGNLGALEIGLSLRTLVVPPQRRAPKPRQDIVKNNGKPPVVQIPMNSKADSLQVASTPPDSIKEVEITRTDTTITTTQTTVGRISQEPLVIEKITLHFHFDYNSDDLDDETEEYLEGLAATLEQDKNLRLMITGHTDNIGQEKFNQRLSEKRAESVRNYLMKRGVSPERLQAQGKGLHAPLNDNKTEADRARNRRVEILMYSK
jgi:type IX secretion system PorP/SprF family membrane protein